MHQLFVSLMAGLVAGLAAVPASADVGFQRMTVPAADGAGMEAAVWYPTSAPASPQPLELFTQRVAADAPVEGARLPLVVISHGTGGSLAGHHDTALALAEAGFVVAALTHPGDNFRDQSRAAQIWRRSADLKALTDYMLGAWSGRERLDPSRIGAFGFSAGGFTVLTAAGGKPDLSGLAEHCRRHPSFFECLLVARAGAQTPAGQPWVADPRIRAIVVAAPAVGWSFSRDGLAAVRQPVQLWRAANDEILPHPYYAEAVRGALPRRPELHVVEGAAHYDFLAPCSPAMDARAPSICVSAPGFERAAFHARFNRDVVRFFSRTLR